MHLRLSSVIGPLAVLLAATTPAMGQSARYIAANCSNCHGTEGHAQAGMPSLAGMDAGYFTDQMKAFREGRRAATIMHQIAKGYTDEELEKLAVYFAAQKKD
jgi:cytochrome subunit of sulfide dehydrogenase